MAKQLEFTTGLKSLSPDRSFQSLKKIFAALEGEEDSINGIKKEPSAGGCRALRDRFWTMRWKPRQPQQRV